MTITVLLQVHTILFQLAINGPGAYAHAVSA